jgi:hypothetical protein
MEAPPQPTTKTQAEWDQLDELTKAQALFAWSKFWVGVAPACEPPRQRIDGARIVIPRTTNDETLSTVGWKQGPTDEERASMIADDWKKS